MTFNTNFYYPDEKEEFLGVVNGLEACQSLADSKADSLEMRASDGWS